MTSATEQAAQGGREEAAGPAASEQWSPDYSSSLLEPTACGGSSASPGRPCVLCTGGLGYIGCHTVLPLVAAGYAVCIVDNLQNSCEEVFARLKLLVSQQQQQEEKRQQQQHQRQNGPLLEDKQRQHGKTHCGVQRKGEMPQQQHSAPGAGTGHAHSGSKEEEQQGDVAERRRKRGRHDGIANAAGGNGDGLLEFVKLDLLDFPALLRLFKKRMFTAVIHYAGRKSPPESIAKPLEYYSCNLGATLNLLRAMRMTGCRNLVFSSSASVYKAIAERPVREDDACIGYHPYSRSKLFIEQILKDLRKGEERDFWRISILRYFNPIGAHSSGLLGEHLCGMPANLVPSMQLVARSKLPHLNVFGFDYETVDGTGVRDYMHVEDLAQGHVAALRQLEEAGEEEEDGEAKVEERRKTEEGDAKERQLGKQQRGEGCLLIYNLGTGRGVSTLEMVKLFEKSTGQHIPYKLVGRRPGDLASVIADPTKAATDLGWRAERSIQ